MCSAIPWCKKSAAFGRVPTAGLYSTQCRRCSRALVNVKVLRCMVVWTGRVLLLLLLLERGECGGCWSALCAVANRRRASSSIDVGGAHAGGVLPEDPSEL